MLGIFHGIVEQRSATYGKYDLKPYLGTQLAKGCLPLLYSNASQSLDHRNTNIHLYINYIQS